MRSSDLFFIKKHCGEWNKGSEWGKETSEVATVELGSVKTRPGWPSGAVSAWFGGQGGGQQGSLAHALMTAAAVGSSVLGIIG